MKCFKSAFNHISLLPVIVYIMMKRIEGLQSVLCVTFYSDICLRNHLSHKLTICDERGECQISCCQVFKYCGNCYGIVKRCEWINSRWHQHDCRKVY